jgi:hypothetical protein
MLSSPMFWSVRLGRFLGYGLVSVRGSSVDKLDTGQELGSRQETGVWLEAGLR